MYAWRNLGSIAFHWAHSEDSDQTERMPRLIWVFAERTSHFVRALAHNCARSCENVSYAICERKKRRLACASAHSDQQFCCSRLRQYDIYTCYIQSFYIIASFCSWAGWFESYLVEHPRRHVFAWCGSYYATRNTYKEPRRLYRSI